MKAKSSSQTPHRLLSPKSSIEPKLVELKPTVGSTLHRRHRSDLLSHKSLFTENGNVNSYQSVENMKSFNSVMQEDLIASNHYYNLRD